MADYAKMYRRLFNSQTQAIEILQKAQQDTEEMYISAPESEIRLINPDQPDKDKDE
jgi:hypothetical protein